MWRFRIYGGQKPGGVRPDVLVLPLEAELKVGYVIEIKNGPVSASVPLEGGNESLCFGW